MIIQRHITKTRPWKDFKRMSNIINVLKCSYRVTQATRNWWLLPLQFFKAQRRIISFSRIHNSGIRGTSTDFISKSQSKHIQTSIFYVRCISYFISLFTWVLCCFMFTSSFIHFNLFCMPVFHLPSQLDWRSNDLSAVNYCSFICKNSLFRIASRLTLSKSLLFETFPGKKKGLKLFQFNFRRLILLHHARIRKFYLQKKFY